MKNRQVTYILAALMTLAVVQTTDAASKALVPAQQKAVAARRQQRSLVMPHQLPQFDQFAKGFKSVGKTKMLKALLRATIIGCGSGLVAYKLDPKNKLGAQRIGLATGGISLLTLLTPLKILLGGGQSANSTAAPKSVPRLKG